MRYVRVTFNMLAALCLAACANPSDDADGEAETAPAQTPSNSDAVTLPGIFATTTTTASLEDGDVANVELLVDGTYVRRRCYHSKCALLVAETDHYDVYTSTDNKTYVRFYSFRSEWNETHSSRQQVPVIADVYEIKKTATTMQLRKSYTTRWLTFGQTTASSLCTQSDGTWSDNVCTCPGETTWSDAGFVSFVAGLGGCTRIPGASEAECDETEGFYTDDDTTAVATSCLCEAGMYLTDTGCAAL